MKVSELIEKLMALPDHSVDVYRGDSEWDRRPIRAVVQETAPVVEDYFTGLVLPPGVVLL